MPDDVIVEAMAAKEGLELENGYDRVVLMVDCSVLKSLIDGGTGIRSSIGELCFDITELGRSFLFSLKLGGFIGRLIW